MMEISKHVYIELKLTVNKAKELSRILNVIVDQNDTHMFDSETRKLHRYMANKLGAFLIMTGDKKHNDTLNAKGQEEK